MSFLYVWFFPRIKKKTISDVVLRVLIFNWCLYNITTITFGVMCGHMKSKNRIQRMTRRNSNFKAEPKVWMNLLPSLCRQNLQCFYRSMWRYVLQSVGMSRHWTLSIDTVVCFSIDVLEIVLFMYVVSTECDHIVCLFFQLYYIVNRKREWLWKSEFSFVENLSDIPVWVDFVSFKRIILLCDVILF